MPRTEIMSHFSMWEVAAFHSFVYSNSVAGAGRVLRLGCAGVSVASVGSPTTTDASKISSVGFDVASEVDPEGRKIPPPTALFVGTVYAPEAPLGSFEGELRSIAHIETGVKRASDVGGRDSCVVGVRMADEELLAALALDLVKGRDSLSLAVTPSTISIGIRRRFGLDGFGGKDNEDVVVSTISIGTRTRVEED